MEDITSKAMKVNEMKTQSIYDFEGLRANLHLLSQFHVSSCFLAWYIYICSSSLYLALVLLLPLTKPAPLILLLLQDVRTSAK